MCGLGGCAAITKVGDTPLINPDAFRIAGGMIKIDLTREPNLQKAGGSVKIIDALLSAGLIVACIEEGHYVTASLHCTHRQVEVEYDARKKQFECASLGSSTYALDGANTGGPAEKPLQPCETRLEGDVLVVMV